MSGRFGKRLLTLGGAGALGVGAYVYYDKPRSIDFGFRLGRIYASTGETYRRLVDPESGHRFAIFLLSQPQWVRRILGLENTKHEDVPILNTKVFGLEFSNPVGLAAGFDKNGEAVDGLLSLGFGFAEIGSVTPQPQPGNSQPRVFRLSEDRCIINRYGFNSDGADAVATRLQQRQDKAKGIVGINLGKNKTTEDATADYVKGLEKLAPFADYVVVNVSSPNTPGLRALQGKEQLANLLSTVQAARDKLPRRLPLLVKIAPDLTDDDKRDIAGAITTAGVDGLVICNTTVERPELKSSHRTEQGGLSGPALEKRSTQLIADMYHLTKGQVPIIGVGGVTTGEDAYAKIKAGASLVQIYTSFVYEGPAQVQQIKRDLARCLLRDDLKSVQEAVGLEHRKPTPFRSWRVKLN